MMGSLLPRTSENSSYEYFIDGRTSEKPRSRKFVNRAHRAFCLYSSDRHRYCLTVAKGLW